MRKKKRYNENDEIEIRLNQCVTYYYYLQWRFKEPRKFLCFNIKNPWITVKLYDHSYFRPQENPDDDFYWQKVYFNMGNQNDIQEYEKVKRNIKTKKDLYDYYNIKEKVDLYFDHMRKHRKWVEETNRNIKKYTK